MKTNLKIEATGIICALGSNITEIATNINKNPNITLYSIQHNTTVPISKLSNIKDKTDIPRAFLLAELAIHQIFENHSLKTQNNKIVLLAGCTKGDGQTISESFKSGNENAIFEAESSSNALNVYLSKKLNIPFIPVSSAACATGAQLLCKADTILQSGEYDSIILCMSEASLTAEMISAFYQLGVLTTSPQGTEPFQKNANGFHMGEGAVAFLLTKNSTEVSNGFICGVGVGTDAKHFSTFPNGHQKVSELIQETCQQIGIDISDLAHVNLHGTGTKVNDHMELTLSKHLLSFNKQLTFSTFKQLTGHLLGASGLTEFALTFLSLRYQFLLPLHHFSEQFSEIKLAHGANNNIQTKNTYFMTLSYGLGGTIGIIISCLPSKK